LKIGRSHEPLLAEGRQNIFTARYQFHLPTNAQLEAGNPTRATPTLLKISALRPPELLHSISVEILTELFAFVAMKHLTPVAKDFWSMRINQQWRLIFRWNDGKVSAVKITDYH
jgi:plasmid maintenance system killer protein